MLIKRSASTLQVGLERYVHVGAAALSLAWKLITSRGVCYRFDR
jgi:hypothetical protein